ncbi:MAG: manganese transporter [Crocinitomicaceae bacterium]|nr:manganese transporter [Crocinitomicaceae bacterium]|tara:strand:- start:52417 stop:53364 length:948 start_codon:yes stop_codon:yes gene_type:complete
MLYLKKDEINKKIQFSILIFLLAILISCGEVNYQKNQKIKVICTTGVIADAISNILPSNFEVKSLMGPGVDPHTYKSKTSEIKNMMNADVIIYNGIDFESNLIDAIEEIGKYSLVVSLGDIVPKDRLRKTNDFGGTYDPHFWHDVNLFAKSIQLAGRKMSLEFSSYKNYIDSSSSSYVKKLIETEKYVKNQISKIPDSSRVLITAHDAFGYYGRLFGIEVKGLQGISTSSDISIRTITELTDFIVSRNIPSIFIENSVSQKNINSVIEGCKSKGLDLKIGGTLYSDGLGDSNSGADSYIKMIKKNTNSIVNGLTK